MDLLGDARKGPGIEMTEKQAPVQLSKVSPLCIEVSGAFVFSKGRLGVGCFIARVARTLLAVPTPTLSLAFLPE